MPDTGHTASVTPPLRLHDSPLTGAELRSAVLDGEVVSVGSSYVCIDEPIGPRDRGASLAPELSDSRAIVCDRTAAWVWGWCVAPSVIGTCVSIAARVASPTRRRLRTREAVIDESEVVHLDGVRVTTPLRTTVDLVRHDANDDVVDIIVAALASGDVCARDLHDELQRRPGIAHQRRARARLALAVSRC